ncbi:hypothetical protein DGo_PB0383 (plasmid) [Deinococcus gobiensis I-0]|uniref:Uncharacterized protein n=1 Tax=Deinococcus gobiensis (strain DSM 21396 / JCM 16679 / CGMCC 1.7299 / I-0) TaxID=745776 RepID=H8H2A5_DEIGI|nr:hypothetical protein DGo_PB0383 [Deinococcus gobiensis I-0]
MTQVINIFTLILSRTATLVCHLYAFPTVIRMSERVTKSY